MQSCIPLELPLSFKPPHSQSLQFFSTSTTTQDKRHHRQKKSSNTQISLPFCFHRRFFPFSLFFSIAALWEVARVYHASLFISFCFFFINFFGQLLRFAANQRTTITWKNFKEQKQNNQIQFQVSQFLTKLTKSQVFTVTSLIEMLPFRTPNYHKTFASAATLQNMTTLQWRHCWRTYNEISLTNGHLRCTFYRLLRRWYPNVPRFSTPLRLFAAQLSHKFRGVLVHSRVQNTRHTLS